VRVVIVGGGFSGCAAALAAAKVGAQVILLERTDMLLGVGLRSGETCANGWFVGQNELRFLGGGEIFDALASIKLYDSAAFPDARLHTYFFDVGRAEPLIRRMVKDAGVELHLGSRATDVEKERGRVVAVSLEDGTRVSGEAFIDCTGGRGGVSICTRYGKGCVMCLVKCVAFGDRLGIVEKAGGKVFDRKRPNGTPGQLAAAMTFYKDTLAPWLKARIEKEGVVKIPLPEDMVDYSKLEVMGAARSREFVENLILSDIGPVAKGSGIIYMPLEKLRRLPGLENVQVENPLSSKYNHIQNVAIAVRDYALRAEGIENLFCGGEKAGHESVDGAIITGYLAGHNAVRQARRREPLVIPRSLAIGDWLAYSRERWQTEEGRKTCYWMSRWEYWERMKSTGLYTEDLGEIRKRVEEAGLVGVLAEEV
jgi:hypothetical protein